MTLVSQVNTKSYRDYVRNDLYAHDGDDRSCTGAQHDPARQNIKKRFESFGLARRCLSGRTGISGLLTTRKESFWIRSSGNKKWLGDVVDGFGSYGPIALETNSTDPMTKVTTTRYTYSYTVIAGTGTANVTLSTGTDLAGNVVTSVPTSGGSVPGGRHSADRDVEFTGGHADECVADPRDGRVQ
jgi:hypothetical protein